MNVIQSNTANSLLFELLDKVSQSEGKRLVKTGANSTTTRELGPCYITLNNPKSNIVTLNSRKNNIEAIIGEALWVLSGRKELPEFLIKLVPRLTDFCDKGKEWRGAYGPRLFDNGQLTHAFTQLKIDPDTRKAVAMIADPSKDSIKGYTEEVGTIFTADNICNLGLVFEKKNGHLDLTILNRSNDIMWGLTNVNLFEFTLIQEIMSNMTGIPLGYFHVMSTNVHLYELTTVLNQSQEIIKNGTNDINEEKQNIVDAVSNSILLKYSSWEKVREHASSLIDMIEDNLKSIYGSTPSGNDRLSTMARIIINKVRDCGQLK